MRPEIHYRQQIKPELPYLYAAKCCRIWECAYGYPVGRCGLCGEKPEFFGWIDPQ